MPAAVFPITAPTHGCFRGDRSGAPCQLGLPDCPLCEFATIGRDLCGNWRPLKPAVAACPCAGRDFCHGDGDERA